MIDKIKEWKANGAWTGIVLVPIFFFIAAIIMGLLWSNTAESGEWFPKNGDPELSLYIELPNDNLYCVDGGQEFNSNISLRGIVWKDRGTRLGCEITHHSCGFKQDVNPSDVAGCGISFKPRW